MANSIEAVSSELSAVKLKSDIGIEVAKKSLDADKQQGEAAIQLLESARAVADAPGTSRTPTHGGTIDVSG